MELIKPFIFKMLDWSWSWSHRFFASFAALHTSSKKCFKVAGVYLSDTITVINYQFIIELSTQEKYTF